MEEHLNWKQDLKKSSKPKQSPHSNPTWLPDLLREFHKIIIANCSKRVRDAVDKNDNIMVGIGSHYVFL